MISIASAREPGIDLDLDRGRDSNDLVDRYSKHRYDGLLLVKIGVLLPILAIESNARTLI